MYTLEMFNNNIRLLASSLILKHHDIGVLMNAGLKTNYGITDFGELTEWKYYLNLSGVKHSTNNDVYVTTVETGERVLLSPDILADYPATLSDLDSRLNSYKELLEEYPDDIIYINGCINPIDINTAIAAEDGTIIGYSKQYLEPQEYSLVRELSDEIKGFFSRWYITEYNLTDELYLAATLSVLGVNIPNMITNIRIRDSYTSEASSFHIEQYFRSHLDIWDSVKYLKDDTIRWLYRNIVSIINSVGTNDTFETILTKVLNENGIGLSTYKLINSPYVTNPEESLLLSRYGTTKPKIRLTALNDSFTHNQDTITLNDMVQQSIDNDAVKTYPKQEVLNVILDNTTHKVGNNLAVEQNTKTLFMGTINVFKAYTNNLIETILDTWVITAFSGRYDVTLNFRDPITKVSYALNASDGILLFYHLLFMKFGVTDPVVNTIRYKHHLKTNVSETTMLQGLLLTKGNSEVAKLIKTHLNNLGYRYRTVKEFSNRIDTQINMYKAMWDMDSNINNAFLGANIKEMISRCYLDGSYSIPNPDNLSMTSLLASRGIDFITVPGYDVGESLPVLFKLFTGTEFDSSLVLKEIYGSYKTLINKLTSYSLQVIPPTIENDRLSVPYSTIETNNGVRGYMTVTDANIIKVLEENVSVISSDGNNFRDSLKVNTKPREALASIEIGNISQLLSFSSGVMDTSAVPTTGVAHVEILNSLHVNYGPATATEANNFDNTIDLTTAIDGGVNGTASTTEAPRTLVTTSMDEVVTTTTGVTVEILGSTYNK